MTKLRESRSILFIVVVATLLAAGCSVKPIVPGEESPEALEEAPQDTLAMALAEEETTGPRMRVHFINVGQGDATLFEFSCGAVLVDTGGELNNEFTSTDALLDYLDEFFDRRADLNDALDALVLTHPHIDHTRSVREVLEEYPPRNAVTNGQEQGSGRFQQRRLHRAVSEAEATPQTDDDIGFEAVTLSEIPTSGLTNAVIDPVNCADGDPTFTVLWGEVLVNPGWGNAPFNNRNNHSVVLRVDYGQASVLLTGDLEDEAIESMVTRYDNSTLLDIDVYQVGHHGSRNGTPEELLDHMTPLMAVISMGPPTREINWTAWQYGHPNKGIIERLENAISTTRSPLVVQVGLGSRTFEARTITDAIYATGWDDSVVLEADALGNWTVISPAQPALLNINTATVEQLVELPRIGSVRAQAIVNHRATHGPFNSVDELDDVPGIGPSTLNAIRDLVTAE